MLGLQCEGPSASFAVSPTENLASCLGQNLPAAEQRLTSTLRRIAVQERGLILKVEIEPELNAGVGDHDADAVHPRQIHRLRDAQMLIPIEDAPDLVVRLAAPPTRFPQFILLGGDRCLDQLEWTTVEVAHRHEHGITKLASPVEEIAGLGPYALGEYEELTPLGC